MPGAGAVHHINCGGSSVARRLSGLPSVADIRLRCREQRVGAICGLFAPQQKYSIRSWRWPPLTP